MQLKILVPKLSAEQNLVARTDTKNVSVAKKLVSFGWFDFIFEVRFSACVVTKFESQDN